MAAAGMAVFGGGGDSPSGPKKVKPSVLVEKLVANDADLTSETPLRPSTTPARTVACATSEGSGQPSGHIGGGEPRASPAWRGARASEHSRGWRAEEEERLRRRTRRLRRRSARRRRARKRRATSTAQRQKNTKPIPADASHRGFSAAAAAAASVAGSTIMQMKAVEYCEKITAGLSTNTNLIELDLDVSNNNRVCVLPYLVCVLARARACVMCCVVWVCGCVYVSRAGQTVGRIWRRARPCAPMPPRTTCLPCASERNKC